MHMEYLFRYSQANSVYQQSLNNRGGAKLVEEIHKISSYLDFMIDVSNLHFLDLCYDAVGKFHLDG